MSLKQKYARTYGLGRTGSTRALLQTAVFCCLIALLLYFSGVSSSLPDVLAISLIIGLSIHLCNLGFHPLLHSVLPIPIIGVLSITTGLVISLTLCDWLFSNKAGYSFGFASDTLYLGVFFGVIGTLIYTTFARLTDMQSQLAIAETKQLEQEKQLAESQLRMLQAQIEPHFLFNTLSNVVGLIDSDKEGAKKTLVNLTTLLRSSLKQTREPVTTLGNELEIVRAFLEIQKIRLGDRLRYNIDVPENLKQAKIPPLLLQPLVENSVSHGIEPTEEGGHISISGSFVQSKNEPPMPNESAFCLIVSDTGVGLTSDAQDSVLTENRTNRTSIGLSNVRERLHVFFGKKARFVINENSPGGVRVSLTIPYRHE